MGWGHKAAKGEGQERCFALGSLQSTQQKETLGSEASVIDGGVAKLEGQKFTCMRDPGGPGV